MIISFISFPRASLSFAIRRVRRIVAIKLLLLVSAIFIFPAVVDAQSKLNRIINTVTNTIEFLLRIAMTLAVLVFVYGVVKLIAAGGNPQKIKEAKGILVWGVIGLFVLASMFGLVRFIQEYFGVTDSGTLRVPQFTPRP